MLLGLYFYCVVSNTPVSVWLPTFKNYSKFNEPLFLQKIDWEYNGEPTKWVRWREQLSAEEQGIVLSCLSKTKMEYEIVSHSPEHWGSSPPPIYYELGVESQVSDFFHTYFTFTPGGNLWDYRLSEKDAVLLKSVITNVIARLNEKK